MMLTPTALTPEQQALRIKLEYPDFKIIRRIKGNSIVVEGNLQPTPLHKMYKVRITYFYKKRPIVTLPEEFFEVRPPHTFHDNSLCLYHPNGLGAWKYQKSITALLPMISHWLWCFEVWKITKVWHGEEYPHPVTDSSDQQ